MTMPPKTTIRAKEIVSLTNQFGLMNSAIWSVFGYPRNFTSFPRKGRGWHCTEKIVASKPFQKTGKETT